MELMGMRAAWSKKLMRAMTGCALLVLAVGLSAAEFWQSKPYTEWADKDVEKMLNNSPWAKSTSVSVSGPSTGTFGNAQGNSGVDPGNPQPISEGGGGRGGRGGRGGNTGYDDGGGNSVAVVARWESALPMKQALAKAKYGGAVTNSPDAKQMLEREETSYVIVVSGPLGALMRGNPESLKQPILAASVLEAKGKDAEKPTNVQIEQTPKAVSIAFYFPRTAAYTVDDKEVDFATKIGGAPLKYRFRLRDMVFEGKLAL